MNRVPLYNEYRLIERNECDINGVWKGAHLLLFFLAFVFGSFCTFCFHMLMYLFDEKCVLFPKLLSLTSLRHNVIYEFIPSSKDLAEMPVDFLSTQWVEKSTCALPTYVPLVSGIFGLVWTTMFLMCSTGSRTLSGLHRPWRVLPPVFLFSLAMGALCIYSSAVTHYGLQELCLKLGEITGSSTCTYTVNVATLTYERRIRGVYQATRLTILSAWLHTACWLLSALLALVRVLLAVDFQLVRVNVRLHGDIDKILEKHEVQIRTVSPDVNKDGEPEALNKFLIRNISVERGDITKLYDESEILQYTLSRERHDNMSEQSLVPDELNRLARLLAYQSVDEQYIFIVKELYDVLDTLHESEIRDSRSDGSITSLYSSTSDEDLRSQEIMITRQFGQEHIASKPSDNKLIIAEPTPDAPDETEELMISESFVTLEHMVKKVKETYDFREQRVSINEPSTSKALEATSELNLSADMRRILDIPDDDVPAEKQDTNKLKSRKSNLKTIGVQTDKEKKPTRAVRVQITERETSDSDSDSETPPGKKDDVDKETQTNPKEKQD